MFLLWAHGVELQVHRDGEKWNHLEKTKNLFGLQRHLLILSVGALQIRHEALHWDLHSLRFVSTSEWVLGIRSLFWTIFLYHLQLGIWTPLPFVRSILLSHWFFEDKFLMRQNFPILQYLLSQCLLSKFHHVESTDKEDSWSNVLATLLKSGLVSHWHGVVCNCRRIFDQLHNHEQKFLLVLFLTCHSASRSGSGRNLLNWLQEKSEKSMMFNKRGWWFNSSRVKLPLVNMSASWILVSTYLIRILGSESILLNNKSSATLWVLDTCLMVGLLPLMITFWSPLRYLQLLCLFVCQFAVSLNACLSMSFRVGGPRNRLLHIELMRTNVRLPNIHKIPLTEADSESSRSPTKSESWNEPNRQCWAVLPTWQYCRLWLLWWMYEINFAKRLSQAYVHLVTDLANLYRPKNVKPTSSCQIRAFQDNLRAFFW